MSGAAIATVTGQLVAGIMILLYFSRFKTFHLIGRDFVPRKESVRRIFILGVPAGANSRQVFCLLPLALIFPLFWGIDGVLWAGPIADGVSGVLSLLLVRREMKTWQ